MNTRGEAPNYNFKMLHCCRWTLYKRRQCRCVFASLPHCSSTCNQTPRDTFLAAGVKIASYWQGELCGVWFMYKQPPDSMSRMQLRAEPGCPLQVGRHISEGNKVLKRDVTVRFESLRVRLATYNYKGCIKRKSGF
jgi:hypothetical protein